MGCGGLASVACKRGRGKTAVASGIYMVLYGGGHPKTLVLKKKIRFGCAGIHARSFTEVGSGIHKPLYATG